MQKRKILFVLHQLNYGGVQKAALTALNAIDYEKNDVTLYIRKNRIPLLSEVNKSISKIIINEDDTKYYRRPYLFALSVIERVVQLFKLSKVEVLIHEKIIKYLTTAKMKYEKEHYFSNNEEYDVAVSYISGYTAEFVAKYINAKKKIMFYHSSTDEHHELHERILKHFDEIVGVNKSVQDILRILYPNYQERITYLNNYVDADYVRKRSIEFEVVIPKDRIILCSCGRFAHVKGFDLAVEAARILKAKGISFKWYFVGDGPERCKLEERIKKYQLTDFVEITGIQDNPYPYIASCDIYVQPSYEESHSLTIVEALILNRPVISTETVGGKYLIDSGRNGILVKMEAARIADAIEEMIRMPELREKMIKELNSVDYSKTWSEYQDGWEYLLGV